MVGEEERVRAQSGWIDRLVARQVDRVLRTDEPSQSAGRGEQPQEPDSILHPVLEDQSRARLTDLDGSEAPHPGLLEHGPARAAHALGPRKTGEGHGVLRPGEVRAICEVGGEHGCRDEAHAVALDAQLPARETAFVGADLDARAGHRARIELLAEVEDQLLVQEQALGIRRMDVGQPQVGGTGPGVDPRAGEDRRGAGERQVESEVASAPIGLDPGPSEDPERARAHARIEPSLPASLKLSRHLVTKREGDRHPSRHGRGNQSPWRNGGWSPPTMQARWNGGRWKSTGDPPLQNLRLRSGSGCGRSPGSGSACRRSAARCSR